MPKVRYGCIFNRSLAEHDMPCLSSVDPDQLASVQDRDLHCLSLNMLMSIKKKNLNQVI